MLSLLSDDILKVITNAAAYYSLSVFFSVADLSYVGFVPAGDFWGVPFFDHGFFLWETNSSTSGQ
jgi:hypothetical protein